MNPNFFDKWNAFKACAETGSLSAAAEREGCDPSLLSRRIQALEEELGAKLLKRGRQGSSPTPAGRRFLEAMNPVIQEFEDLEAGLADIRTNSLHLFAPESMASSLLAGLVQKLAEKRIKLHIHPSRREDALPKRPHEYSIYFGDEPPNADVVAMKLGAVDGVVAASSDYLEANGDPQDVSDLRFHRILFGPDLPQSQASFLNQRRVEELHAQDAYELPSCSALLSAAASGAGVAVGLPRYAAHEMLVSGALIELPASRSLPVRTAWLLRLAQRYPDPSASVFIKELKNIWNGSAAINQQTQQ